MLVYALTGVGRTSMTEWTCPWCKSVNETELHRDDKHYWAGPCPKCKGWWKLKWDSRSGKFVACLNLKMSRDQGARMGVE